MVYVQVYSIAACFGVRAFESDHPARLHEKYHLTSLVRTPEAGILTRHGDMLVHSHLYLPASGTPGTSQPSNSVRQTKDAHYLLGIFESPATAWYVYATPGPGQTMMFDDILQGF